MRRRPASAPAGPEGVVVGTLAAADDVVVAPRGAVHHGTSGLRVEWVVGTAEGWVRGADVRPTAIGQRLLDGVPVVETSLRVPGGQVVQRVWAVADGGAEVAVLEVENRSKEAVSVALAIDGARRLRYDGELGVEADGARLAVGRRPSRVVAGGGDPEAAVEATPFEGAGPGTLVWPLAHTATLRVAVVVDGTWRGTPASLPDADAVVRGWRGHLDAGARVALPDPALAAALSTARCEAMVLAARAHDPATTAALAAALGSWGHHEAALAPIEHLVDLQRLDGSFERGSHETTAAGLAAWALHVAATDDRALAERLAEPAAKAAHRLGKLRWKSGPPPWVATAQRDAAALLDRADQPEAAELCRTRVSVPAALGAPAAGGLGDLAALLPAVGVDLQASLALLLGVRHLLVDDTAAGSSSLLTSWPDEWLGADLEAHRLPTRHGQLSFAVRWHGARPALLWEREGTGALAVPGLDASWSTEAPSGEALLAPVEPAGGLPGVVRPLEGEGTPVDDAPDDGRSFG